jgi:hypothetical protein
MHARARHRCGDAGRKIAIGDQPDTRAGFADIGDQLLVARAVEHYHDQVVHTAREAARNGFEVMLDGRLQIDGALGGRPHHDFFHVAIGRVQQSALVGCGQHSDGPGAAGRAQVRTLQRIDRDVHAQRVGVIFVRSHLLADEEHGRLVALALADDDGAFDRGGVQAAAHFLDRGAVRDFGVTHAHGARGRDGGVLHHAQHLQRQIEHIITSYPSWKIPQL